MKVLAYYDDSEPTAEEVKTSLQERIAELEAQLANLKLERTVTCLYCDKSVAYSSIYRCYDCDSGFHKDCLKAHISTSDPRKYLCARRMEQQLADEELAFNHANEVIGKLEIDLAEAKKVIEAARCIRHWHDAMRDESGMVVSSAHVRALWLALENYDAINAPR